jgi:hypothetical protein
VLRQLSSGDWPAWQHPDIRVYRHCLFEPEHPPSIVLVGPVRQGMHDDLSIGTRVVHLFDDSQKGPVTDGGTGDKDDGVGHLIPGSQTDGGMDALHWNAPVGTVERYLDQRQ